MPTVAEMPCSPMLWFDVLRDFLSLLPAKTMRLDSDGFAALHAAGLSQASACAAVTGLRWQGEAVVTMDAAGVQILRLAEDGEEVQRPTEGAYYEDGEPEGGWPKRVVTMATDAQKDYLRSLGYAGVKPIDKLTCKKASRHIARLKKAKEAKSLKRSNHRSLA